MKNLNKAYVLLYTFYICASVFWIIGSIILLKRIQTDIHSQINQTWEQCILTDYRERLSNVPNKNIRKIQNALLEYERLELESDGHLFELFYDSTANAGNRVERETRMLQTALLTLNPIQINNLDSLFQKELEDAQITGACGIIYSYPHAKQKIVTHSVENIGLFTNSYRTPIHYTGANDDIQLQGFVQYPLCTYFHRMGSITVIWCLMAFLIVFGFFIQHKRLHHKEIDNNNSEPDPPTSDVGKTVITYRIRTRELITQNQHIQLTPLQGKLFACLLERSEERRVGKEC